MAVLEIEEHGTWQSGLLALQQDQPRLAVPDDTHRGIGRAEVNAAECLMHRSLLSLFRGGKSAATRRAVIRMAGPLLANGMCVFALGWEAAVYRMALKRGTPLFPRHQSLRNTSRPSQPVTMASDTANTP